MLFFLLLLHTSKKKLLQSPALFGFRARPKSKKERSNASSFKVKIINIKGKKKEKEKEKEKKKKTKKVITSGDEGATESIEMPLHGKRCLIGALVQILN